LVPAACRASPKIAVIHTIDAAWRNSEKHATEWIGSIATRLKTKSLTSGGWTRRSDRLGSGTNFRGPTVTASEVVPFGKYKGQAVEVLLADDGYRDWLMSQDWFRARFGTIYQTIINYGGQPQDSPEHNEMQASFLNDDRCFRLARLLYPSKTFDKAEAERAATRSTWWSKWSQTVDTLREHLRLDYEKAAICSRKFEAEGWDVVFGIDPGCVSFAVNSLPKCLCSNECDHGNCLIGSSCRSGEKKSRFDYCRHRGHEARFTPDLEWWSKASSTELRQKRNIVDQQSHCHEACPWHYAANFLLDEDQRSFYPSAPGMVRVECKPDLGDDFPTVLRQVTRYPRNPHVDRCCVIARRHGFEKVTWEQVTAIFKASAVILLQESQLVDNGQHGEAG
jgi:uncharacterized protein (DUF3820 family)